MRRLARLAPVIAGAGALAGSAQGTVSVTAIPCSDYVSGGACAYSYAITLQPGDVITRMPLEVGGPGVSTAQFDDGGTGALGAASFSGVSPPITFSYAPKPGASGVDRVSWQVTSQLSYGARATSASPGVITITIASPVPAANNASINTTYETTGSTSLTASNTPTAFAITSGPAHGAASISGSTAIYTPDAGYFGADSFTVYATNAAGRSPPATVSVTVAPPPAPSVAAAAITTAYETTGSTPLTGTGVVAGFAIASSPAHGAATISGSSAVYTPDAGFYGTDSFTLTATGPGGTSSPARVSVTVGDPPAPTLKGATLTPPYDKPVSVTLSASGVVTRYQVLTAPAHGSATLFPSGLTYTPSEGYIGPDSFTLEAVGPGGASAPATFTVTVEPPPAPVAKAGSITCPYQTTCRTPLTSTGLGSTYALASQASNGTCSVSGSTLTYVPAWGAVGSDSCTFTVTGPGGTSQPAVIYITNEPPPLLNPSAPMGTPIPTSGASTAVCAAGQSASIPGLPGPPTGTAYDPNWCDEQALTITQQALELHTRQSQIMALRSALAAQQEIVQGLGADGASATLASVNAQAARILQQATGIGFNAQSAGASFAAAYPGGPTVAGFNGSALNAALQSWQANTRSALQASIAIQNQIAQSQAQIGGAVQTAVAASNTAAGPTAAHQATNRILAAVSTQLAQLQDVLLAESQAYAAVAAAGEQAAGAAASLGAQTQGQTHSSLTAAPGVDDTRHM